MRRYPKGCRYIIIEDGTVGPVLKTTRRCRIEDLTTWRPHLHVLVQPRGRLAWWAYTAARSGHPNFVAKGQDPDPLIMEVLLRGVLDG